MNHKPNGKYASYYNCIQKEYQDLCVVCFVKCVKRGSKAALYIEHEALHITLKLCLDCRVHFYLWNPEPVRPGLATQNMTTTKAQKLFKLGDAISW